MSVTLPDEADPGDSARSLRLTSDREGVPAGLMTRYDTIDDAEAAKTLLDTLVRFYKDAIDYNGDIVVTFHEATDRDPLAGSFGSRTIYLEFGAVRAEGYRLA